MEKKRKGQVLDGTESRSLNSACRQFSSLGRLFLDLRQQQLSAELWETKKPSFSTAPLALHGDGPSTGGLNKAFLTRIRLASSSQKASLPSSKKNSERKKTESLKVACLNIRTMQDSEDHSW